MVGSSAAQALLDHPWGQSEYEDRVWAQVAGMAPRHVDRCCFMIIQAFVDESIGDDGTFVMAGHLASVDAWAAFSKEWEHMLPRNGVVTDDGEWHFHMTEMAKSPERMSRVPGFYRIIEKHVFFSLSCHFNIHDLKRAIARIEVPGVAIEWGQFAEPYTAAFRVMFDHFNARRQEFQRNMPGFPRDAVVDFYFDDHSDKKKIRAMWEEYLVNRPLNQRRLIGQEPRFEDDRRFLPLQAADLWAWWVRRWEMEGRLADGLRELDFGSWKGVGHNRGHIRMTEDHWVKALAEIAAFNAPPYTPIKDRQTGRLIYVGNPRNG